MSFLNKEFSEKILSFNQIVVFLHRDKSETIHLAKYEKSISIVFDVRGLDDNSPGTRYV